MKEAEERTGQIKTKRLYNQYDASEPVTVTMLGDNEDLVKSSKTQKKSAGLWNPFRGANDIGYGSAESNFRFCWSLAIFHVIF